MNAMPPRRQTTANRVPLPAEVRAALKAIADDLRNMPRDCIHDRLELIHWLNRLARRVEAERDRTVVAPPGPHAGVRPQTGSVTRWPVVETSPWRPQANATARDRAEAVFKAPAPSTSMPPKPRTVTSRKGRAVRVEVRRARLAGQIEMPL